MVSEFLFAVMDLAVCCPRRVLKSENLPSQSTKEQRFHQVPAAEDEVFGLPCCVNHIDFQRLWLISDAKRIEWRYNPAGAYIHIFTAPPSH